MDTAHRPPKRSWLRDPKAWLMPLAGLGSAFWSTWLLIVLAGAILRTYRIDMPPIDFPGDRQRTNGIITDLIIRGQSLAGFKKFWFELWILPWLTAKSRWLCPLLACDLWTLGRLWPFFFGNLAVIFAAPVGFLAAKRLALSRAHCLRIALLFTAAIAFNPYHISLSRAFLTEPVTLAFQMLVVFCFLKALDGKSTISWLILFSIMLALSGLAKIPSLFWLPAFALCFLFHPRFPLTFRVAALAVCAVTTLLFAWHFKINLFNPVASFKKVYSVFGPTMAAWQFTGPWNKSFLDRLTLMLTIPGLILAVVGFFRSPWLFRLAMLSFLVLFYPMLILNTYNYCHAIIPGMALAAFGADLLIQYFLSVSLFPQNFWDRFGIKCKLAVQSALACIVLLAGIFLLYPFGPPINEAVPPANVLQATQILSQRVPKGTSVLNDDVYGLLGFLHERGYTNTNERRRASANPSKGGLGFPPLDLSTGYFFLFERFRPETQEYASKTWVDWASLSSEPLGMLLVKPEQFDTQSSFEDYERIESPSVTSNTLAPRFFYVPRGNYNKTTRELIIGANQTFKIGIQWNNPSAQRLAGIRWSHPNWGYLSVPLREGGYSVGRGGVLCLPPGSDHSPAFYTFELPGTFPPGKYSLDTYPQPPDKWISPKEGFQSFPFAIVCEPSPTHAERLETLFSSLYPLTHDMPPQLWSEDWFFKNMQLEGYRTNVPMAFLMAFPGGKAGKYKLSIQGGAQPMLNLGEAGPSWPKVNVYLPSDKVKASGQVLINRNGTHWFETVFEAPENFDSIHLRIDPKHGELRYAPPWMVDFNPISYEKETAFLRKIRLERIQP